MHPVGVAVGLCREITRQALGRNVSRNVGRVHTGAGCCDGAAVDVGGEYLHLVRRAQQLNPFPHQNGNRIGFFTGRTPGGPDANHGTGGFAFKQFGNNLLFERFEGLWIAEKVGDTNQQVAKKGLHFNGRLLQVAHIVVHPLDLMNRHAALNAAVDGVGLVLREVVARLGPQQDKNLVERTFGFGGLPQSRPKRMAEYLGHISNQLRCHFSRWQLVIHQTGGDGAAWHTGEFGRCRVLRHDHAAPAFDGPHTQRAVAACARQHNTNGPLLLVQRQRAKQKIDRQAMAARGCGFQQVQCTIQKSHVAVGRDDVGTVDLHHHAVGHLKHLHARVALHQCAQNAVVVRGQVLHQHKRHAGVSTGGHAGEKGFKSRQSAGRGTNAHNGKPRGA